MKQYIAKVLISYSSKRVVDFIAAAGLGITGFKTEPDVFVITWKPGEFVDEARVQRALDKMTAESKLGNSLVVITGTEILSLEEVDVDTKKDNKTTSSAMHPSKGWNRGRRRNEPFERGGNSLE